MGAALRLLVTQSEHSLVYGVQKVCVPNTSDLRTLADLEAGQGVRRIHIAEALSFRRVVPGRRSILMNT